MSRVVKFLTQCEQVVWQLATSAKCVSLANGIRGTDTGDELNRCQARVPFNLHILGPKGSQKESDDTFP